MDSVIERTSGATLFGQLGCSLRSKFRKSQRPSHQGLHSGAVVAMRIPQRGADHPPQTGSRYARRRHPQSGLSFPEMLRTFQGVGKEHQGVEVATLTEAPRPPSKHLILPSHSQSKSSPTKDHCRRCRKQQSTEDGKRSDQPPGRTT